MFSSGIHYLLWHSHWFWVVLDISKIRRKLIKLVMSKKVRFPHTHIHTKKPQPMTTTKKGVIQWIVLSLDQTNSILWKWIGYHMLTKFSKEQELIYCFTYLQKISDAQVRSLPFIHVWNRFVGLIMLRHGENLTFLVLFLLNCRSLSTLYNFT